MKAPLRTFILIRVLGACSLACLAGPEIGDHAETRRSFPAITRTNTAGVRPATDRAFFGAPPPIRHLITSERATDCLQCHARTNRIELRQQAIAPVPHAEYSQCTQCHVKGNDPAAGLFKTNTFIGLDLPGKGSRAHPFAPPTVPHKTFMRDNCLACHGPTGLWRIRTPHPFRTQCVQCHAPEAAQDHSRPASDR